MKISKKLIEELNKQAAREFEAAYIYKGMSQYLSELGAKGFSHWLAEHVKEELEHAQDFIDFVEDMGAHVEFYGIDPVPTSYDSILEVWEKAYEHELEISSHIRSILELALEEKNYAAENFLRTYIDEQVEEEDKFLSILELVRFAGDDKAALLEVDKKLAIR